MPGQPPQVGEVVIGSLAVLVACTTAAAAFRLGWRSRSWHALLLGCGASVLVIGVVGQQSFVVPPGTLSARPGAWEAGISVPWLGLKVSAVELAGMLIGSVGLSLVLFFDQGDPAVGAAQPPHEPDLETEDTV